jgi:hypothetical protein
MHRSQRIGRGKGGVHQYQRGVIWAITATMIMCMRPVWSDAEQSRQCISKHQIPYAPQLVSATVGKPTAAISNDGTWLVTCAGDSIVCLWEVATSREVRRFRGHTGYVCAIALSDDAKWLTRNPTGNPIQHGRTGVGTRTDAAVVSENKPTRVYRLGPKWTR